jgi:hypothetical protein
MNLVHEWTILGGPPATEAMEWNDGCVFVVGPLGDPRFQKMVEFHCIFTSCAVGTKIRGCKTPGPPFLSLNL